MRLNLKTTPELARQRKNAQNRAWYARNRAAVVERHRQWRKDNPDYDAQYMRDKRAQGREHNDEKKAE